MTNKQKYPSHINTGSTASFVMLGLGLFFLVTGSVNTAVILFLFGFLGIVLFGHIASRYKGNKQ